jgi:hypothetical protein
MEQKIIRYKKIYKFFIILTLIGFIDLNILPVLLKELSINIPEGVGLIPLFFGLLLGNFGITIGIWFIFLWFVWGIIAISLNSSIKKLEKGIKK